MKKFTHILFVILAGVFFTGCGMNPVEKSISTAINRDVLYQYDDVKGDGYGPGYYIYPEYDREYKRNAFDLTKFSIEDAGNYYFFKFSFAEEIKKNTTLFGRWDQILIDVYIDKDQQPYSGETSTLNGRDCFINSDNAWESMVLISPVHPEWLKRYLEYETQDIRTKLLFKNERIIIPDFYIVGYNTITAKIPKYALGNIREWWGYQVFVMGFDEESLGIDNIYATKVSASPGPVVFGGGSSYYGNPNILDILDDGDLIDQKKILSDYEINPVKNKAKFASVPMVYNKRLENKERLEVNFNKKAERIVKKEGKKENNQEDDKKESQISESYRIHRDNMIKILEYAIKYRKDNADDPNITIFDLMLNGYLTESIKAPDRCIYKINDQKDQKLKIECSNIDGEILLVIEE